MHTLFCSIVPRSAPAAVLLLVLPLLLTDTDSAMAAADCGPAGSFSTPQERHAARVRLLTGGSGSLIHTESADSAEQCAEFIRRAYQMRIGSLAGISIDWSAVEAALRRTMNDAAREALDYACDYAVTNAETAVDNGLGALSRAAAKLSGGMVAVKVSGALQLQEVTIDPEAVDPEDVEMLQDMIVAAVNQGIADAQAMVNQKMSAVTGGLAGLF